MAHGWTRGDRIAPADSLAAVTDNAGGALFVWAEFVPHGQQQYVAQHVTAEGTLDPRWPALGRRFHRN